MITSTPLRHHTSITYLIAITVLGILIASTAHSPATCNTYDVRQDYTFPLLFVSKVPNKREVRLGEWFSVTIYVANLGNATAFDIQIIDEQYPQWTIETRNHSTQYYVPRLDPNITICITYELKIIASAQKNVSLGRVIARYRDAEGNTYEVISEETLITVKVAAAYISIKDIRRVMLVGASLILIPSIVALIIVERKVLAEYLATMAKKKR